MPLDPTIETFLTKGSETRKQIVKTNIEALTTLIADSPKITGEVFQKIVDDFGFDKIVELRELYNVRNKIMDIIEGRADR